MSGCSAATCERASQTHAELIAEFGVSTLDDRVMRNAFGRTVGATQLNVHVRCFAQ
jgi:hypothetical protein